MLYLCRFVVLISLLAIVFGKITPANADLIAIEDISEINAEFHDVSNKITDLGIATELSIFKLRRLEKFVIICMLALIIAVICGACFLGYRLNQWRQLTMGTIQRPTKIGMDEKELVEKNADPKILNPTEKILDSASMQKQTRNYPRPTKLLVAAMVIIVISLIELSGHALVFISKGQSSWRLIETEEFSVRDFTKRVNDRRFVTAIPLYRGLFDYYGFRLGQNKATTEHGNVVFWAIRYLLDGA